jgi:FlaA1/EpsC-like NDP-sugar epimerase
MKSQLRTLAKLRNRYLLGTDSLILVLIPALAVFIRTESTHLIVALAVPLTVYMLVMISLKVFIFIETGLYQQYWPYASVDELVVLLKSMALAAAAQLLLAYGLLFPLEMLPSAFPRSIPILDSIQQRSCSVARASQSVSPMR